MSISSPSNVGWQANTQRSIFNTSILIPIRDFDNFFAVGLHLGGAGCMRGVSIVMSVPLRDATMGDSLADEFVHWDDCD